MSNNQSQLNLQPEPWQTVTQNFASQHQYLSNTNPKWSLYKTAAALNISQSSASRMILVARYLDDPKIASASSFHTAYRILARRSRRNTIKFSTEIKETISDIFATKR